MDRSQLAFILRFDGLLRPEKASQFVHLLQDEMAEWQIGRAKIYDVMHNVDPDESDQIHVTVRLTSPVDERTAKNLHATLKEELEFGDSHEGHYRKMGWGMGKARLVAVEAVAR